MLQRPVRILLAEANATIRGILREVLGRAGAEVVACRRRDELDVAVHDGPYDAVIADVQLGRERVDAALFALRLRHPLMPILILTESARLDPLVALVAHGIFFKPYPDLVEVARYALSFARQAAVPIESEHMLVTPSTDN